MFPALVRHGMVVTVVVELLLARRPPRRTVPLVGIAVDRYRFSVSKPSRIRGRAGRAAGSERGGNVSAAIEEAKVGYVQPNKAEQLDVERRDGRVRITLILEN